MGPMPEANKCLDTYIEPLHTGAGDNSVFHYKNSLQKISAGNWFPVNSVNLWINELKGTCFMLT